jgi:prephenate dehydrogenase
MESETENAGKADGLSLAVVGMGLIGGSFYKAARRAGYETFGLHHGETEGLGRADVVLVCLPPKAIVPWIREHAPLFKAGAAVIDICGVKTPICRDLAATEKPTGWRFVGGHPMAGKEVTGFENSTPDLFLDKSMVLCPAADEPADDPSPTGLPALAAFFRSLGFSRVVVTTPAHHDEMIAFTSQLGHVIASAYAQDPRVADSVGFSAGSFANMSRIATIDPETWCDLYLADREALLGVLDDFLARLRRFRDALDARDEAAIKAFVAAGAAAKRRELSSHLFSNSFNFFRPPLT